MSRRQFFTQKERKRYYKTLEIYHPTIGVLRFVNGRIDPLSFGLEASAPRNAGETVEFLGAAFEYSLPEQNENVVTMEIQLGRVGRDVKQKLKAIRLAGTEFDSADVVIREYIEGELTTPMFTLRLFVASIAMTFEGVAILTQLDNPAGRNVAEIATIERFPGLAEVL